MSHDCCRVYEHDATRTITGNTIRPGGIALTEVALGHCTLLSGTRVLDVGCGAAATIEYLTDTRRVRAIGLDLSWALLSASCQRRRDLPVTQANGENLPFPSGSFDILLAECCLSLMDDGDRALAEFARVLRAGGTLILSDIYARNSDEIPIARRLPLACCLSKALSLEWLQTRLIHHHLRMTLWEDHTAALNSLAAQIIFAHGSLEHFWRTLVGDSLNAHALTGVTARLKPGYFLLLAQKET
ncbi:DVU_1556 family methyltransferase [Aggregatilinea lenta]|uniref:DVU_1556 family methyltransferase n=1 Tax=Aggregatilinea lenta TaxID=913108 RepID=UPI0013C2D61A|nr:class I SAM-dependent methyltransferase [Aggregatilinea lenta]